MALRSSNDRYGSVAIALHWISAVVIIGALGMGLIVDNISGDADTLVPLRIHIILAVAAVALTLGRIAWWVFADRRPAPLAGVPRLQHWAASANHLLMYAAILVLGASGIATLILSGAMPALIGGGGLPDFSEVAPRQVHGLVARAMIALVALHIGAALYHQFVRRDRLLARMGIGRP